MASLERHGNGWRVCWREGGRGAPLKRSQVFTGPRAKDDARDEQGRVEAELAARKSGAIGRADSLETVIYRWRDARIAAGNDPIHMARTAARIASLVRKAGWTTCASITPSKVEAWRKAGGSPRSGATLAGCLRWAMERDGQSLDARALIALRPGRAKRRPAADLVGLDQVAEWQRLADRMGDNVGALVHCLATYGWRPISAARMLVADVSLRAPASIACRVKGGDVISHPLRADTIARLRLAIDGRAPSAPLFLDPRTGKAWNLVGPGTIGMWWRDWMKGRVYDLKRWAISHMLAAGLPAADVQLFTGHRTPGQVLRYGRTNADRATKALESLPVMSQKSDAGSKHGSKIKKPVGTPGNTERTLPPAIGSTV